MTITIFLSFFAKLSEVYTFLVNSSFDIFKEKSFMCNKIEPL